MACMTQALIATRNLGDISLCFVTLGRGSVQPGRQKPNIAGECSVVRVRLFRG